MDLFDEIILPPDQAKPRTIPGKGDTDTTARRLLSGLNPEQAAAVQHHLGPLLILAGAGSGKTRVITHRIAWLVSVLGVRPSAILAITFTNKAAAEMKSRIEELVGAASQYMWVGTFHAMMIRILRRYADRLGYDRNFTIIDIDDQVKLIKSCLSDLNLDEKAFAPKAVHGQISAAKNALIGTKQYTGEAGADFRLGKIARVYERYQEKLKKSNSMDFDDILFEAVGLLSNHPDVLAEYQDRFQFILVDEYQDTNHAQYKLVHLLSAKHENLCVVGDDDQSIYSFRGANIQNILDFEKDFKNCRVIKLEQNYRSTGNVLKAANAVINLNRGRKQKTLWTQTDDGEPITFLRAENQNEEGRYLANEIDRLVVRSGQQHYRDFAVLYRLNALSRNLEQALREQGIPYRIFGGMRFYDRKEIKDVLAYLRLILTAEDDLSLNRIINVPRRGIGDATVSALEILAGREGTSQLAICARAGEFAELQRMAGRLQGFAALIERLRAGLLQEDLTFAAYIEWVEQESGLIQEMIDQREKSSLGDSVDRIENLKELLSDALEFERQRKELRERDDVSELAPEDSDLLAVGLPDVLRSFLERAALYSEMDEDRENQDYVRLMTIHSAKGLEFGTVFLVGAEEGLFPGYRAMGSEADIEEERRLAYVAITRARSKLYITTARSRLVFGQTQSMQVSRFVREIPDQFIEEVGGARHGDLQPARPDSKPVGRGSASISFPGAPAQPGQNSAARRDANMPAAPKPGGAVDLKAGDRVRHPRFGVGKVISSEPVAGDAILLVAFESVGQKRLMARMANLSPADT
ncbi:MAG: UvrD-helicase domain-containing protein [Clostridiaceae bacterium]|nr:UvrD-helicase domain-containing protein [Clostridiaceae bacterium]